MFGSDYPSIPYERIMQEWDELGYDDAILEKVFHANAERVLGLADALTPDGRSPREVAG
jgi:predicted TIM-barrel fold metal-dependent hydrolase